MLKRHFYYYLLKPYLPKPMRMAFRRIVARWKLRKYSTVWPINEIAGRRPVGWPGWPEGRKFAVILTHDVEGAKGLEQCRHLAELEMKLGFRSSFNFIPEGPYAVPADLRSWLVDHGFEVGVHDLKHDGKLYANHAQFRRHANRINQYLSQWNSAGFRSGFMHHHQEWLHDLNVKYDASTFDTDPFEPQPDGVGTIFPFWVPAPNGNNEGHKGTRFLVDNEPEEVESPARPGSSSPLAPFSSSTRKGYVELPYTLPQDSTLFMLLREKTGDIWRAKLDWIVSRGGMALINVHPDYLHLKSTEPGTALTAEDHYTNWLRYLTTVHHDSYWHVLPRDMAAFVHGWKSGNSSRS